MRRSALLVTLVLFGCPDEHTIVKRPSKIPKSFAIENVDVLDVVTGSITPGRTVVVRDGLIAEIVAASSKVEVEHVIEGAGRTLLPGLIDTHGHTGTADSPPWDTSLPDPNTNLLRFLYCGVTRVFDPGSHDEDGFERRAAIERGELLGPRIHAAGPAFTTNGGHPVPMLEAGLPAILAWYFVPHYARQVGTPEEAKAAVEKLIAEKKPDIVKMAIDELPPGVPRLGREVATALTKAANAKGVRTVAHIGTTTDAIDAAEAGVAAWIHGVYKQRIADADIERLAAYRIPMVPTLIVFDSYAELGFAPRVASKLEKETVSEAHLERFDEIPDDFEVDPGMEKLRKILVRQKTESLENVRRLRAAGVTILAGSDAQPGVFHGPGLHRELRLLVRAGLPPIEAIRAATLYAARFLSDNDDPPYGIIAVGKQADLLLVNGNPLEDLTALERIEAVIAQGVPLVRAPLP